MNRLMPFTLLLPALVSVTVARDAQANPMDLAPERLQTCTDPSKFTPPTPCGEWRTNGAAITGNYYRADNAAFAKLMSQYAMAIAPTAMHPARTTGYGGFEMSLFGTMTTISKDEAFMKMGTEGPIGANTNQFASSNATPDSVLQLYGVSGRKGLPYGFELQGSVAYMANTELVSMGGGIRWSIFEGFRKGVPGAIPDISVGGYVNTLTGSSKVKITVPALDVQISKPFTVANQLIIQPYIGWQLVWVSVDSAVVDGTPKLDGLSKCNGRVATPAERAAGDTGEFHCQDRTASGSVDAAPKGGAQDSQKLDLNNNMVFSNLRYTRQRAMLGIAFRYEIAHFILHAMTDIVDPEKGVKDGGFCSKQPGDGSNCVDHRIDGLAKQWTFGFTAGVTF